MKKFEFDKKFHGLALQDYFSLGYLFLIILGLINSIIYYETLGVNIFYYIGISDILLMPLNTIFSNYIITFFILISITIFYFSLKYFFIYINAKKKKEAEKEKKEHHEVPFQPITLCIFLFVSLFLGLNIGTSTRIKENIEKNAFRLNHTITMADNSQKEVYVIGQNSTYLFYIEKNSKNINIMPIGGNIKSMKKI